MTTICAEEVSKLRRMQRSSGSGGVSGGGAEGRAGVNAAVSSDVSTIFKGKTVSNVMLSIAYFVRKPEFGHSYQALSICRLTN